MTDKLSMTNTRPGRMNRLYMAAIEQALYCSDYQTVDELRKLLAHCEPYSHGNKPKVSARTIQGIIKQLREAYETEYGILSKDSIRVSRSGGTAKYILGDKARSNLLYPENIFYSKTDRDKLNLLLRVGEYFSLPMDAFLKNASLMKEGAEELFEGRIEVSRRPFLSKVFVDVFHAIETKQVITFKYETRTSSFQSSQPKDPVVTPYYLKSYANKWYLIAHVRKSQNRWTIFALDRISEVKICKDLEPYYLDVKVIERFYENVIGFFVPPNPDGSFPRSEKELDIKQIAITMKNESGAFFLDKNPIHSSQRRSSENPLIFHINCLDNIHLYQALLRILDDIRWIEPPIVRNRLLSKLEEAQNLLKPQHFCDEY